MPLATFIQRPGRLAIAFSTAIALSGCETVPTPPKYVVVNSAPQQASLEIRTNNSDFHLAGITPTTCSVAPDSGQLFIVRLTAPGYYKAEKAYPINTLPAEVTVPLDKVR